MVSCAIGSESIRRFSESNIEAMLMTDSGTTAEALTAAEPAATTEPTAGAEGMTATSGLLEDAPPAEAAKED